jgi:nitrite reductase/ring-hydroxylating ferredoxin subunit
VIVSAKFQRAGTIKELTSKGRLVVRGAHRPILVVEDRDRVYALDNLCPHMGFPLDGGSIEDGILTCHWHHARFDLASGCTFDLWADDVPTCAVELRGDEVWIQTDFGHSDAAAYWQQRLEQGMAHIVIAKAIQGQLAAGVPSIDIVRQAALFGARNRDGWDTGMTILTVLGNLLEETYLALFHGVRRVAADCDGTAPTRQRSALSSRPGLVLLNVGNGAGLLSAIARQPSAPSLPPFPSARSRRCWRTCSPRPRPTASMPTTDTRLIFRSWVSNRRLQTETGLSRSFIQHRQSHDFLPPLSHRLDHQVSLQGAAGETAGASGGHYPASLP